MKIEDQDLESKKKNCQAVKVGEPLTKSQKVELELGGG